METKCPVGGDISVDKMFDLSDIVYQAIWPTGRDVYIYAVCLGQGKSFDSRLGYGVGLETYKSSVDIKKQSFYHDSLSMYARKTPDNHDCLGVYSWWWSWRDLNPRPNAELMSFLHA